MHHRLFRLTVHTWAFEKVLYISFSIGCSSELKTINAPPNAKPMNVRRYKMRLCISILFSSLIIGCGNSKQETSTSKYFPVSEQQKTLDFDFFTITVPSTWQKANDDTIPALTDATARGRIQIGQHEFLSYEDGLSAFDMSESDTSESANKIEYKVRNGQINGFKAKYFRPNDIGNGFTGVYIDSVDKIESVANLGFSLYGKNLDSIREAEFVKSIQTIKYKHPSY